MPRTIPTTQAVTSLGATVALGAPDALGDIVEVGRETFILVVNGSAGAVTVTAQTPATVQGAAVAEVVLTLAAGATGVLRLDPELYARDAGSADAGKAYIDYSAVTSVTRAVMALS